VPNGRVCLARDDSPLPLGHDEASEPEVEVHKPMTRMLLNVIPVRGFPSSMTMPPTAGLKVMRALSQHVFLLGAADCVFVEVTQEYSVQHRIVQVWFDLVPVPNRVVVGYRPFRWLGAPLRQVAVVEVATVPLGFDVRNFGLHALALIQPMNLVL